MKKNYLLFIIDSLNYSHLKESPVELMPFLNELKNKGIYCDNMFSQAPYTEAAVMNLYCGQDVLQDNGYFYRFRDAKTTIFEQMKKAGYITYYNSYQPQCHPSSIRRGIDYIYYNVGYDQEALWTYRLRHFSELYNNNKLNEDDIDALIVIFDDNFTEWRIFTEELINGGQSTEMIRNNTQDYNPVEVNELVSNEYNKYLNNKEEYIIDVLKLGTDHRFFKIPSYVQDAKIKDRSVCKQIKKEMTPIFKRIKKMNRRLNLKNCKGLFKGLLRKFGRFVMRPGRESFKDFLKCGYLVANEITDLDLYKRINNCDRFKNAPSARTHINHYMSWVEKHRGEGSHFACIHIDDIHNPEVFFTYDSDDIELIKWERSEAEALLDKIPETYYGSLSHELSLKYIDNVLKHLYDELKHHEMLEDTCVIICADHGFSFSGNPLRDSFVLNYYLENYNIPCIFTGTGLGEKTISSLRASKDIPATICKLAIGEVPKEFSGHTLTDDYEYDQVQIEYCGGGCPDLGRRKLRLAAFNKTYFVGTVCDLYDSLGEDKITEIYDLVNDPKQLYNIRNSDYDEIKVKELIQFINNRRFAIKESLAQRQLAMKNRV